MSLFLTVAEMKDLTDIKQGKNGKNFHEMQCDWLNSKGIPFYVSRIGRPRVSKSIIEGIRSRPVQETVGWQSAHA